MKDLSHPALSNIDCWIFDLDNSLYPASCDLFELIDARMTEYVARLLNLPHADARRLQKDHFRTHGTTLAGLMAEHGVDPHDFLDYVHDIELGRLVADPELPALLARLPGRKLIFTNGAEDYANRVLDALGLVDSFEGIHDIHACDLIPKPRAEAYSSLLARWSIDPTRALFVEDMAKNLAPAKAIGMTTVWIDNGSDQAGHAEGHDFVDIRITDLGAWLRELAGVPA